MSTVATLASDCLPGYRFLESYGRGVFGQLWKAQAPDGRYRLVQLISGFTKHHHFTPRDRDALETVLALQHPSLLNFERAELEQGQMVLVSAAAEITLWDRFEQCRSQNLPGIPRAELLGYLRAAAEALDYLDAQNGAAHLALHPRNLWIDDGRLLVGDYALAQTLWVPAGLPLGQLTPRYAAPEVLEKHPTRSSDQYALALIYQEMLTGVLPQRGGTLYQITTARLNAAPDLEPLPPDDREVLARALHADPDSRFFTCVELIDALAAPATVSDASPDIRDRILMSGWRPGEAPGGTVPDPAQLVANLVSQAMAESLEIQDYHGMRCMVDADGAMVHRCAAWLPPGVARQKLEGFLQQWKARVVQDDEDCMIFHIELPNGSWHWFKKKTQPVLAVEIRLARKLPTLAKLTEVTIRMEYLSGKKAGNDVLEQVGPAVLESLRTYLLAPPEQRIQERFPFEHPLRIAAVGPRGETGRPIDCMGRDISYGGLSFHAPREPAAPQVNIYFTVYLTSTSETAAVSVPALIRRVQPHGEDGFLVGARFLLDSPNKDQ